MTNRDTLSQSPCHPESVERLNRRSLIAFDLAFYAWLTAAPERAAKQAEDAALV